MAAMKVDTPIALVTGSYRSHADAAEDFEAVWAARHDGDFHHTAIAVLSRDPAGILHAERRSNTAEHLHWGGALLGAPIFVLAPEPGTEVLAAVGLSGAGAIACHLRLNALPTELATAARVLEAGGCSLVVVVVNRRGDAIATLLRHAAETSSVDLVWGDLEEELSRDFATPMSEPFLVAV